jgi:hypothetical protein
MKLTGVGLEGLAERIESRLRAEGVPVDAAASERPSVEPRVDPRAHALDALAANADPTEGLPLQTHRAGLQGAAVLAAKRAFRVAARPILRRLLARQAAFNSEAREAYALLSGELEALRTELKALEADAARAPPAQAVSANSSRRRSKTDVDT